MSKTELEMETEDKKSIHKARLPVDCQDGFFLLGEDSDLHLTSFGIFGMPFGLCNAPVAF